MAPQHPGSCRDCLAWGVFRETKWLCGGCRSWRQQCTRGTCAICRREDLPIGVEGACRLCWRQGAELDWTKTGISLAEANRDGQQLFLANMHRRRRSDRGKPRPPARTAASAPPPRPWPVAYRQLTLFDLPREFAPGSRTGLPEPPDPALEAFLIANVNEYATRHGWTRSVATRVRMAIRALLALQDTPGAPIAASAVEDLVDVDLSVHPTLAFLDSVGFLHDDRVPALERWFTQQITALPEAMTSELRAWFDVLRHGSNRSPRSHPRTEVTIRTRTNWVMPAVRTWASQGHDSLREISRADVLAVLPGSGNPRVTMGAGLRSLFSTLRARRLIFTNPLAGIRIGETEGTQPLPADLDRIRAALHNPNPTKAAICAVMAFHGLRTDHLRHLLLTDVRDHRLHLGDRTVLLAEPVQERLAAYLDYRATQWPNTANPHLFINRRTAGTTESFGPAWVWKLFGFSPRLIWEDRILHEALATGGDVRRLCDLFGITVACALRYTSTLNHPELSNFPTVGSRAETTT